MEERPTNHILLRSFLACVLSVLAFCITVLFFVAVGVLGVLIFLFRALPMYFMPLLGGPCPFVDLFHVVPILS